MENKANNFDNLEALTLLLFNQIKEAEYEGASTFKVLKLLYQLKEELPKDHILQEDIPFYWYNHGPYSEPVKHELVGLTGEYLIEIPNSDNKLRIKTDFDINEITYDSDVIDQKVTKIIRNLMKKRIFSDIESIVYAKAPYPFMPLYKLDFWKKIEKYKESIVDENENPDLIEAAIELGYKCEAKLPSEPYYSKYEELFSKFLTDLDKINYNDMASYYYEAIENETKDVWFTFAQGLRVKHHEPVQIYEIKINNWDRMFNDKLKGLKINLNRFRSLARKRSMGTKVEFSDNSKRILSSTLGTYIK